MNEIGIGVIGPGRFAASYHLPALAGVEGIRRIAIADAGSGRAQELGRRFGFPHATSDYRRILDRADVDAVFVLTQYAARREIILAAAAAGKHVFTQKPLAGSAAEGAELVAAARRAGVRLVTSFLANYFPETRVTKRLLDEDAIGRVVFVRQRNAIDNTYARALELGGATWDIGPHGVAMIHFLTGRRIVRVQAMMDVYARPEAQREVRDGRPIDTLATMSYTLSDGSLVSHEVQWTAAAAGAGAWTTELFGERGGILLRPHIGAGLVALAQRDPATGKRGAWQFPEVQPEQPLGAYHHQLFVDDVRFDRHESATPEEGLATLRVLEAAYRSAAGGVAVDVEP